jgi:hypothetical protein
MFYKRLRNYFRLNYLKYIFGRFNFVRKIHKIVNKNFFTSKINPDINEYVSSNIPKNKIIDNLVNEGFSTEISLKKETNNFILNNYKNSKFISYKIYNQERYEFKNFNHLQNSKIDIPFFELHNNNLFSLFDKISRSKILLDIATSYLGNVKKIDTKLTYSTVVNVEDSEREKYRQTVNWHYDVHDLNFLYIFFYISGADKYSGAHEIIKNSHNNKSFFKHLIRSAKQNDNNLRKFYKEENFFIIEGSPGEGFIEDTSCFHRALKPSLNPRLCLQFRYH